MPSFIDKEPYRWITQSVFISSTFRDFHAERDYLIKYVFPKLRKWCLQWKLHLSDIDLRWGITDEQRISGKVLKLCLKGVDDSRPFFVCLLGGRYGYVLNDRDREGLDPSLYKEYEILEKEKGWLNKSLTHLEVIHSALKPFREDHKKTAFSFFYLRDGKNLPRIYPYYSNVNKGLLEELKDQIRKSFGNRVFEYQPEFDVNLNNPEDPFLNNLNSSKFNSGRIPPSSLRDLGNRVLHDLQMAISIEHSERIKYLRTTRKNDFLQSELDLHEAFVAERTQESIFGRWASFIGRKDSLIKVENYVLGDLSGVLAILGEAGSGKTSLLSSFYKSFKKSHSEFLCIPHFIGASPRSSALPIMLRRLCEILKKEYKVLEDVPLEFTDLVEYFRKTVRKSPKKTLIIIDGLNQLDETYEAQELRWLPSTLPKSVRIIVSTLPGTSEEALKSRPETIQLNLDPLGKKDIMSILNNIPTIFAKTLPKYYKENIANKEGATNPLWLKIALEELRMYGSHDLLQKRIDELGKDLIGLVGQVITRLSSDLNSNELVESFFCLLVHSHLGLTEDDIELLLKEVDPANNHKIILTQLRSIFQYRNDSIDIFHSSIKEAVRHELLDNPRDLTWHKKLGTHFKKKVEQQIQKDTQKAQSLLELLYQLNKQSKYDEIVKQLSDVYFMNEWVRLDSLISIINTTNSLSLSKNDIDSTLIPFLRANYSVIQKYPNQFISLYHYWLSEGEKINLDALLLHKGWRFPRIKSYPIEINFDDDITSTDLSFKFISTIQYKGSYITSYNNKYRLLFYNSGIGQIDCVNIDTGENIAECVLLRNKKEPNFIQINESANYILVTYTCGNADVYHLSYDSFNKFPISSGLIYSFRYLYPLYYKGVACIIDNYVYYYPETPSKFLISYDLSQQKETKIDIDIEHSNGIIDINALKNNLILTHFENHVYRVIVYEFLNNQYKFYETKHEPSCIHLFEDDGIAVIGTRSKSLVIVELSFSSSKVIKKYDLNKIPVLICAHNNNILIGLEPDEFYILRKDDLNLAKMHSPTLWPSHVLGIYPNKIYGYILVTMNEIFQGILKNHDNFDIDLTINLLVSQNDNIYSIARTSRDILIDFKNERIYYLGKYFINRNNICKNDDDEILFLNNNGCYYKFLVKENKLVEGKLNLNMPTSIVAFDNSYISTDSSSAIFNIDVNLQVNKLFDVPEDILSPPVLNIYGNILIWRSLVKSASNKGTDKAACIYIFRLKKLSDRIKLLGKRQFESVNGRILSICYNGHTGQLMLSLIGDNVNFATLRIGTTDQYLNKNELKKEIQDYNTQIKDFTFISKYNKLAVRGGDGSIALIDIDRWIVQSLLLPIDEFEIIREFNKPQGSIISSTKKNTYNILEFIF